MSNYFTFRRFTTVISLPSPSPSRLISALHSFQTDLSQVGKVSQGNVTESPLDNIDAPQLIRCLLKFTNPTPELVRSCSFVQKSTIIYYAYKTLSTLVSVICPLRSAKLARFCFTSSPSLVDNVLGVLEDSSDGQDAEVVTLAAKVSLDEVSDWLQIEPAMFKKRVHHSPQLSNQQEFFGPLYNLHVSVDTRSLALINYCALSHAHMYSLVTFLLYGPRPALAA